LTHLTNFLNIFTKKRITSAGTQTRVPSKSTVGSLDDNTYTTDVIKKRYPYTKPGAPEYLNVVPHHTMHMQSKGAAAGNTRTREGVLGK
jgi:hypothetical protein